jgi:Fe2+ or Zn2+ uptake regulation protein
MHRKSTRRDTILGILKNTRWHPTADQLYNEARKIISNISKGTVYRNLQVLKEMGEISELNLNGTVCRYEAKRQSHYHFRCEDCGRVFDLNEPVNNEFNKKVAKKTGFKIYYHQLEFRGLCKDCQRKKKIGCRGGTEWGNR